jgi:hypothetical protein
MTQSPYGVAYGAKTGARAVATPNIDEYLKPDYASRPTVHRARATPSVQRSGATPALSTPATQAVPDASAAALASAPAAKARDRGELAGNTTDRSRYAQREQSSQAVEQFRGGDAIVITSGALILILLVVILILLLR